MIKLKIIKKRKSRKENIEKVRERCSKRKTNKKRRRK